MSDTKRRLAAILFADIQGYTALMGKDENHASTLLRKFQKEIESLVTSHQGQVVNLYGDGALCTFDSPLDAVRCGVQLQQSFQRDPQVPVRIGIHSGTVVFENGKVYGDSVNVASRIESMGLPGAVLLSKKVRDELKNQPEFKLAEMGEFEFKNVEEPIRVFALQNTGLVVPDPDAVEGKFQHKETKDEPAKRQSLPIKSILAFLAILSIGALYWIYFIPQKSSVSTEKYLSVLVMPFEVQADPDLAYLGNGLVDLISSSFDGLGPLRSIDPNAVLGRLTKRDGYVRDPEFALNTFSDFNPDRLVLGALTKVGNDLHIIASLYDGEGELLVKEMEEASNENNLPAALDKLCRRLVSTEFKIKEHEDEALVALSSANMGVLKKYLEGNQLLREANYQEACQAYEAVLSMDSTLALGWYKLFYASTWGGNLTVLHRDTITKQVKTLKSELPPKYQLYFDLITAVLQVDFDQIHLLFEKGRVQYKEDPDLYALYGEYLYHHGARDLRGPEEAKPYFLRGIKSGNQFEDQMLLHHLLEIAFWEGSTEEFDSLISSQKDAPADFQAPKRWLLANEQEKKELEKIDGFFSVPHTLWEVMGPSTGYNLLSLDTFNRLRLERIGGTKSRDMILARSLIEQVRGKAPNYYLLPEDRYFYFLPWFVTHVPDPALFPAFPSYFSFKEIVEAPEDFDKVPKPLKIFSLNTLNAYCGSEEEYQTSSKALIDLFPTSKGGLAKWYYYYGAIIYHRRAGRNDMALALMDSLQNQVVSPDNLLYYNSSAGPIHFITANILLERGEYEEALKWYESISYMHTTNALLMGQAVIQKAKCLEQLGRKQEALKNYTYFLELFQDCDPYYDPWMEEAEAARLRIIRESD
jgi:class 3 adenylate cyclase